MEIVILPFGDINGPTLHEIYRLRTAIFVVEQKCAYQEVDAHDPRSLHLVARLEQKLIGTARVCPPGTVYPELSIGRVAVSQKHRKAGVGKKIFAAALQAAQEHFPGQRIKLQAQCYLEAFYASFGFETISEPYPDVGIMHVDMLWQPAN